jgi:hypothetical protein
LPKPRKTGPTGQSGGPFSGQLKNGVYIVKACARKPGIEKALSVRKWIESVRYTKKTIGVDFVLVGSETEKQEATTTEPGDVPRRSIDGKDPMEGDSTPSARSAENGENLIPSDVRCRAGGTIRNEGNSVARTKKHSARLDTSDSFQLGGVSKMAGFLNFKKLRIPISFPNLSHSYWTHYHLSL